MSRGEGGRLICIEIYKVRESNNGFGPDELIKINFIGLGNVLLGCRHTGSTTSITSAQKVQSKVFRTQF